MALFEKFGEMDSIEEINRAAEGLKAEGDKESLLELAKENGVEEADAQDYLEGYTAQLIPNAQTGAFLKIDIEVSENRKLYEGQDLVNDWISYIRLKATESEEFARAVRRKGKRVKDCIGSILKWSFGHQLELDSELLKAAGITGRVSIGVPGMGIAKELIDEYYLG